MLEPLNQLNKQSMIKDIKSKRKSIGSLNNIEHDYLRLLKDILDNGVAKQDRTGTGTISIFGRQIRHKMSEGFPLITTKKMPFKTITTELLWFLRGDTNIKYLVDNNCHIWDGDAYKSYSDHFIGYDDVPNKEWFIEQIKTDQKFAEKWGDLGPIYGKQWRKVVEMGWHKEGETGTRYIDQITNLINDLKTNPDSRRLMVSAWNVGEIDQMTLPPCHYGFQVYTRELSLEERRSLISQEIFNRIYNGGGPETLSHSEINQFNTPTRAISLMWNQRSADTFLGLPFNIASYGLLLELIAREVNMVADELIGNLGDTHLYLNHIEQAKEQIGREPFELPTINFNTEWWDKPFFEAINNESFCKCLLEEDIQLGNYKSHPAIKATLSN